ncbi:hypothetical protein DM860_009977 [Cuscuta australis]|uniref:Transcription factor CBF/NF-Y/archaeal histone domain-containing protein n=1 Tax=Cuscuta australis TaxID=267555 RepID=A0A328DBQ0_9ASTE|nr:hypothetical protein DM860_009977 [Cuscuta australis]
MAEEKEKGAVIPAVVVEDLPKTIVRRLVKEKLSQLSRDGEMSLLRDALQAFTESARIFIHYLSAAANDNCMESKRQTMNAEDVFKALEDIEFSEFVGPLKASLEEFRLKNSKRKAVSSKPVESNKKSKGEGKHAENGKMKGKQDPTDNPKGKHKKTAADGDGAGKAQIVESEEKGGQETNGSEKEEDGEEEEEQEEEEELEEEEEKQQQQEEEEEEEEQSRGDSVDEEEGNASDDSGDD